MQSEQIEYCGECPSYEKCMELARKGRLRSCGQGGAS